MGEHPLDRRWVSQLTFCLDFQNNVPNCTFHRTPMVCDGRERDDRLNFEQSGRWPVDGVVGW